MSENPSSEPSAAGTAIRPSLAERLVTSSSLPGAILVAVIAVIFIVGFPLFAKFVHGGGYPANERFEVAPGLTVIADEGWEYDDSTGLFFTLTKGGAQILFVAPTEPLEPLEDAAKTASDGITAGNGVPGETMPFTTTAGDGGLYVTGRFENSTSATWIFEHEGLQAQVFLNAPDNSFEQIFDSAEAIVLSSEFATAAAS